MSASSAAAEQNAKRNEDAPSNSSEQGTKPKVKWANGQTEGAMGEQGITRHTYESSPNSGSGSSSGSNSGSVVNTTKKTTIPFNPDWHTLLRIGPDSLAEYWDVSPKGVRMTNSFTRNTRMGDATTFNTQYNLGGDLTKIQVFQKLFGVKAMGGTPAFNGFLGTCSFQDAAVLEPAFRHHIGVLKSAQKAQSVKNKREEQLIKWFEDALTKLTTGAPCGDVPPPVKSSGPSLPSLPSMSGLFSKQGTPSIPGNCLTPDMIRDLVYIMALLQGKVIPATKDKLDKITLEELLVMVRKDLNTKPNVTGKNYEIIRKALDALDMVARLQGKGGPVKGDCPPGATEEEKQAIAEKAKSETETRIFSLIWLDILRKDAVSGQPTIDMLITELRSMITKLEECTKHEARIAELEEQLKHWREQSLQQGLLTFAGPSKEELDALRQQIESLKEQLGGRDKEILALLRTIDELLADQKQKEADLAAKQAELADLQGQLAAAKLEIEQKSAQITELEGQISRLQNEIEDLNKDYDRSTNLLHDNITDLNAQIATLNEELMKKTGQIVAKDAALKGSQSTVERLEKELAECREALQKTQAEIGTVTEEKQKECEEKIRVLTETLEKEKSECEKRVEAEKQKCQDCDTQLEALRTQLTEARKGQGDADESAQKRIADLEAKIANLTKENEELNAQLAAAQAELEGEQQLTNTLKEELENLRTQLAACENGKKTLDTRIQNLLKYVIISPELQEKAKSFLLEGPDTGPGGIPEDLKQEIQQTQVSGDDLCQLFGYLYNTISLLMRPVYAKIRSPDQQKNIFTLFQNLTFNVNDGDLFTELTQFWQEYFGGDAQKGFTINPTAFEGEYATIKELINKFDATKITPKEAPLLRELGQVIPDFSTKVVILQDPMIAVKVKQGNDFQSKEFPVHLLVIKYIQMLYTQVLTKHTALIQKCGIKGFGNE